MYPKNIGTFFKPKIPGMQFQKYFSLQKFLSLFRQRVIKKEKITTTNNQSEQIQATSIYLFIIHRHIIFDIIFLVIKKNIYSIHFLRDKLFILEFHTRS